jgi:hypothetical protein
MARINIGNIIDAGTLVKAVIDKAADSSSNSLEKKDAPKIIAAVTAAVNDKIIDAQHEVTATIAHVTNIEPWYQSRVTIGAIVSILVPLLGLIGVQSNILNADQLTSILLAAGTVIGGLFTLWGRWISRKPLGA